MGSFHTVLRPENGDFSRCEYSRGRAVANSIKRVKDGDTECHSLRLPTIRSFGKSDYWLETKSLRLSFGLMSEVMFHCILGLLFLST